MQPAEFSALTTQVLWAAFLLAVVFGAISQRTHFCTMGALSDAANMGDWTRLRQWALAAGIAMIGFAVLAYAGQIDPARTLYASRRWMWLSAVVGGLLFGFGMVIASGCGSKTLVRVGGGSLKATVVFVVMGVAAYATLRGITAVLRVNSVDLISIEFSTGADLASWAAAASGFKPVLAGLLLALALGGGLVAWALVGRDFRRMDNLLAGLGIGGVVVAMWWVSGHLGFVNEHPQTLDEVFLATNSGRAEALTFSAPMAYALDWLMLFSDKSKVLTTGVVTVAGVIVGFCAGGAGHRHVPLGRFRRHGRRRQPPGGRGPDGGGRRHRAGLLDRAGTQWGVHPERHQLCSGGSHRGRRPGRLPLPDVANRSQHLMTVHPPSAMATPAPDGALAGIPEALDRRFGGLARLYGVAGARRIRAAHVAVVGVGGVGSWAAEALARSGVGQLTLIDLDHVSESNINRQVQALETTLGQAKVLACESASARSTPTVGSTASRSSSSRRIGPHLLPGPVDAVIDACDQVRAKTAMAAWARSSGHRVHHRGCGGRQTAGAPVDIEDLARTTHDPLLAQLRYRLAPEHGAPRDGRTIGMPVSSAARRCNRPTHRARWRAGDGSLNCHGYGSVVTVTATFGLCAAGWVLERIASDNAVEGSKNGII